MDHETRARLRWIEVYEETGDAGLTCRRCGISRPTLRKWLKRYAGEGEVGLRSRSRRPVHSPKRKVYLQEENWILELRRGRKLGARRIQQELIRLHECHLSLETIHKVLKRHQVSSVNKHRQPHSKLYVKSLPGERVQLDTRKIGKSLFQYTAVDDFSRFMVAELYPRRTAANTLDFLELVLDAFAVPVQCVQTDRGSEFIAYSVQVLLRQHCIKYRPTRPGSPYLNGKVERAQRTAKDEFWSSIDLSQAELANEFGAWIMYYNYQRVHSSLGMTPVDRFCQRVYDAPEWADVIEAYDPEKERFYERDYSQDRLILQFKTAKQHPEN